MSWIRRTIAIVALLAGACTEPQQPTLVLLSVAPDNSADVGDVLLVRVARASDTTQIVPPQDVEVTSTQPEVITVYDGRLHIISVGVARLDIRMKSDPSQWATVSVTTRGPHLYLDGLPAVLEVGDTPMVSLRLTPRSSAEPMPGEWVSSDPNVLSVPASTKYFERATFVARGPGKATVTVTSPGSPHTLSVEVTVRPRTIAQIKATPATLSIGGRWDTARVRIEVRSGSGLVLHDQAPSVQVLHGRLAIDATVGDTSATADYTQDVRLHATAPGRDTILLRLGEAEARIPVDIRSVGDDSSYAHTGRARQFSVGSNDFVSAGDPPVVIVSNPAHGTAAPGPQRTITYTSTFGFVGVDTVRYSLQEAGAAPDTGLLTVRVLPGPYNITALGVVGAAMTGVALNDAGDVAGNFTQSDGTRRAFRWRAGVFTVLASPAGDGIARAMNAAGDVVGSSGGRPVIWLNGTDTAAFLYTDAAIRYEVADVNDAREVLLQGPSRVPVIWKAGVTTSTAFGSPPTHQAVAFNNAGDVIAMTVGSIYEHWRMLPASTSNAGCGGGRFNAAIALNEAGDVLGSAEAQIGGGLTECLWRRVGGGVDLRKRSGGRSFGAIAINDSAWALLHLKNPTGKDQFGLFAGDAFGTLPELLNAQTLYAITGLTALNGKGDILGQATNTVANQAVVIIIRPAGPP